MNDRIAARAIAATAREEMRIAQEAARMRQSGAPEDEIAEYVAWDSSITENRLEEERQADEWVKGVLGALMQSWLFRTVYAVMGWLAARLERRASTTPG